MPISWPLSNQSNVKSSSGAFWRVLKVLAMRRGRVSNTWLNSPLGGLKTQDGLCSVPAKPDRYKTIHGGFRGCSPLIIAQRCRATHRFAGSPMNIDKRKTRLFLCKSLIYKVFPENACLNFLSHLFKFPFVFV